MSWGVFVVVGAVLAFVGCKTMNMNDRRVDGGVVALMLGVAMVIAGIGVLLGGCIR